jgi:hypothetical protein
MKIVKFLKRKSYGQTTHKVGESMPMREDHANLLQYMGIVVIEDSPVMKIPIPGVQASILTPTPEKKPDLLADPPENPPVAETPGAGSLLGDLTENEIAGNVGLENCSEPSNEPAGAEAEAGSDPKSSKGSAKNRKPKAERKANENENAD